MAQFSVEITPLPGSVLGGNQHTVGTTPFGTSGQTLSSTLTITNGDNRRP